MTYCLNFLVKFFHPNTINFTSFEWLYFKLYLKGSPLAQVVKNLPAVQETQVQSLNWEDLLEKGMATHSNILAWRIPWTEEPGGLLLSMGSQRFIHNCAINIILQVRHVNKIYHP